MTLNISLLILDTSNFWVVNWYYILAVLLSLTGVVFGIKNYFKKNPSKETLPTGQVNPVISPTNNNTNNVTVHIGKSETEPEKHQDSLAVNGGVDEFERLKKLTHILFIDDDTKFKIVQIIIKTGWKNTESIVDLEHYDDDLLRKSHIIFVDVQGVGKVLDCKDEGLSLALNIKNKYPQKKVVIYSAVQAHKVFHEAIQKVDFLLSKDAEPIEFTSLIERFSKEINL